MDPTLVEMIMMKMWDGVEAKIPPSNRRDFSQCPAIHREMLEDMAMAAIAAIRASGFTLFPVLMLMTSERNFKEVAVLLRERGLVAKADICDAHARQMRQALDEVEEQVRAPRATTGIPHPQEPYIPEPEPRRET